MAVRWAVATGNWSSLATWDGGASLPGVGDDVYPNGFNVTINQDITVANLYSTTRSGGTAGGSFLCSTARTITANITGGTTVCLQFSHAAGVVCNVIGNVTSSGAGYGIQNGNGTVNVTGSITTTGTVTGYYQSANGVSNITGNITGGASGNAYGLYSIGASSVVNVIGNVTGGTLAAGLLYSANSGSTCTVTGNVTGGSGTNADGIWLNGTGALVVNGDVYGGSSGGYGIRNWASGSVTVNGKCDVPGTTAAVYTVLGGITTINGTIYGGSSSSVLTVVHASSSGTTTINGDVYAGNGAASIAVYNQVAGGTVVVNGTAFGGNFGVGGVSTYGVAVQSAAAGCVTKVKKIQFGPYGAAPTLGPVTFTDLTSGNITANVVVSSSLVLLEHPSLSSVLPSGMTGGFSG